MRQTRYFASTSWLLILLVMIGCRSTPVAMPDMQNVREGDMILTNSGELDSFILLYMSKSTTSHIEPEFSHTEIIVKDDQGRWCVTGVADSKVRIKPLEDTIVHYGKYAIVRPDYKQEDLQRVATLAKDWIKDEKIRNADFNYTFEDIPGQTDKFYCVSYINEIYRRCNLTELMPAYKPDPSRFLQHINRLCNLPEDRTINSTISIFKQPGHQILVNTETPLWDPVKVALNRALCQTMADWYEQGWQLKQSTQSDLLLKISPYPQKVHDVARLRISLTKFAKDVKDCWERLKRRGQLDSPIPSTDNQQMQSIFLKYRERYFVKTNQGKIPAR